MAAIGAAGVRAAQNASLPGGTSISVAVTAPADGATLPQDPVTVTGTASVGTGQPVASTTLIYIVDVSNSTSTPTGSTGRCPKQNVYDTSADTTLDCELLAVRDLNAAAIATGTVAQIGMIAFAGTGSDTPTNITSAAALDLSSATGVQTLVAPDANDFTPVAGMTTVITPHTNLDWVVQSAYTQGGSPAPTVAWPARGPGDGMTLFTPHDFGLATNYVAALDKLLALLPAVTTTNTVVVFLSDGAPTTGLGGQVGTETFASRLLLLPTAGHGLTMQTFAVGGSASCAGNINGSLETLAARYGNHCQLLPDPSDAVDVIPDVVASQLKSIALSVDDGTPGAPDSVNELLPHNGPTSADFASTLTLAPGPHQVCATASGSDGGGDGSTPADCVNFTIKALPTVTILTTAGTVDEGSTFHLSANTSADPLHWSAAGGTGHCTFANPASANTDVVCDDNGVYTLTLTANDGVNPAVSAVAALTVNNVAPHVTAPPAPGPVLVGQTVPLSFAFTDPGTNDTFSCVINWGDSSTTPGTIAGGTCQGSHAYASSGSFTVTATVSDDDGGAGSASVSVSTDHPPVCGTVTATPNVLWPPNNQFVNVSLTGGTDPDGDPVSVAVTGVTQNEAASAGGDSIPGGSSVQLRAKRDGSGDGRVYSIAFTLTDPLGASCSGVVTVSVPHDQRK